MNSNWQQGVVDARSAPGHAVVLVGQERYLLEHDPEVDNHLVVGTKIKVQVANGRILSWLPLLSRGKR